jgi:hypothetical protein
VNVQIQPTTHTAVLSEICRWIDWEPRTTKQTEKDPAEAERAALKAARID